MMAKAKLPGVREVAQRAGVSLGTVSRVLNHSPEVAAETRARVEQAMRDCDFIPSRAAGQLRSRRSGLVGVLVPDVGNPYWASVIRGAESVLAEQNLSLVVGSTRQDPRRQRSLAVAMTSQGIDGLLVAPIDDETPWQPIASRALGVVVLEGGSNRPGHRGVHANNVSGAARAVTHLLELGHRQVTFLNGPRHVSWCAERWEGAYQAFIDHGADPAGLTEVTVSDLTVADGARAAEELLASGNPPAAIFCANDLVALGVLLTLRSHDIAVPAQVSLIGYDDAEFASALNPPLTTVRQHSFELGVAAANALLRGSEREAGPDEVAFSLELVVRDSTAPPPA